MSKIKLGDEVRDRFTDLKGTVVAIAEYLYGCKQCAVQQRELYNGMVIELAWIDMPQLIKIKSKKVKKTNTYGGVRSHPR